MSRRRSMLACALAGALGGPARAQAQPSPPQAIRLEIVVTSAPAEDYGQTMRHWVASNQAAVLERAGFVVSEDAARVIRTEISFYGEFGIHTRGTLALRDDAGSARAFTCQMCKDSEILARVDEATAALARRMQAERTEEPTPVVAPMAGASGSTSDRPAVVGSRVRPEGHPPGEAQGRPPYERRRGPVGALGLGSLAAGLGLTLGGIIVLQEEPSVRLVPLNDGLEEVSRRTPLGAGLTGAGLSLLVVSAVLLTVDRVVLRRSRAHRPRGRLTRLRSPTRLGPLWNTRQ